MARKRSAERELDDMMECSICTEEFTDPRVLPCIHTFCLECLQNYGKDSEPGDVMLCPLCRKEFVIPDDGLEELQKNFFVEKFLNVKKLSAEKVEEDVPTCDIHENEAKVFCLECKTELCMLCFMESHKDHNCCDIDMHKQIKDDKDKVNEDLNEIGEYLPVFEKDTNDMSDQLANTESEINKTADSLIDAIQYERKQLLSEVESIRLIQTEQVETVKEEVDQHRAALESFTEYSDTLLSSGSACDVMKSAKSLHERADELTTFGIIDYMKTSLPRANVKFMSSNLMRKEAGNLIGAISEAEESAPPSVTYIIPKGSGVTGVTSLGDDIFVVRYKSQHAEVYDALTFTLQPRLALPMLGSQPYGLAVCPVNRCLYISDWNNRSMHRVDLSGRVPHPVAKWAMTNVPAGLSVNGAQNVVVVSYDERKLQEYTTHGRIVRSIQLQADIEHPWHAIQLSADKFVLSHLKPHPRVCVVDVHGVVIHSYGGPADAEQSPLQPFGLAVDRRGNVLVADCRNNRLLVLDQSLSRAHELPVTVDGGLQRPYSLCYDEPRRRLYVGEWAGGRVIIVDNVEDFSDSPGTSP